MRFAARFVRPLTLALVVVSFGASALDARAENPSKLDRLLQQHAARGSGRSRVIIRAADSAPAGAVAALAQRLGSTPLRGLGLINGYAGDVPSAALNALADSPLVAGVSADRVIGATMERTAATIGALEVRQSLGYDGRGIGVAIVDSGVAVSHDDLSSPGASAPHVTRFVDFVSQRPAPYDDHGHGTHVTGIIAGNGYDSGGARAGIAPGVDLIVLKVLDASGTGRVSNVIAALDYVVANRTQFNIRVVNMSIRAGVYESYNTDPLTLAAQRAVQKGIVVTAAAGNLGRSSEGRMQYGGITAPGNAPWVLTVGASNHMGTVDGSDDSIATFSSRGPGVGGYSAKPDLVAPGVGIESLSAPGSTLYSARAQYLLSGTVNTPYLPYLSLSGTSMSAPVVTGTVALMLQANPSLRPNQVKAILQYTATVDSKYDPLTQGAGFLNARGAVALALHFAAPVGTRYPASAAWSRRLVWGNRLVQGGRITPDANAWSPSVTWGATTMPSGKELRFGDLCTDADCEMAGANWIPWGLSSGYQNVVWGSLCGGGDCQTQWDPTTVFSSSDSVVWGMDSDAVVWGMEESVVWGMDDDAVVWGMNDDSVVWGLACSDPTCEPVIWGGR